MLKIKMNISLCYLMMPSPFSWYKFVFLQRHQLPLGLFETLIHLFQPYPAAHFISFPLLVNVTVVCVLMCSVASVVSESLPPYGL